MEQHDSNSEILELYREQADELNDWWNRYEGGLISRDELVFHVEAFVKWHVVQESR